MTKDDVLFGYRQQLFAEAARTSVSAACRTFGVHRSTYYAWKRQVDRHGLEMLRPRERRRPQMPNALPKMIEERIVDRHVLKLLRAMLRSGVMQDGAVRRSVTGTPQGGVISPCLCNVYLHRLDRQWTERGAGVLVRYADDLLALCRTRAEAEAALAALRVILAEMGLELKDAKTRIVHLEEGGEGVDFLGFHHRWVRARGARHVCFLARWPSRQGMQHARDRVREITDRRWLLRPVDDTVQEVNSFLRGWAGYFRYGNSAHHFGAISNLGLNRSSQQHGFQ